MRSFLSSLFTVLALFGFNSWAGAQNLADLFEDVSESVVVIGTLQAKSLGGGTGQITTEAGLGSGVLISDDGMIWTAAHVIQIAEDVQVKFKDGQIMQARVVSSSPGADLALIQVIGDVKGRKTAKVGDSDNARVGDDVFVIGAPKGLEYSLSRGIISGKASDRVEGFGASAEFLQIDAAINPGNSGGPVFNMQGEVIGIASFILSESGGFEGIGFAATSNIARSELNDNRIWGGINGITVDGVVARALNVPGEGGYLVTSVSSKGLGAQVGLKGGTINATIEEKELMLGGDIIIELAGYPIHTNEGERNARKAILSTPTGGEVEIKFLRAGELLSRKFTILD